jgi:hypothetical protein
VIEAYPALVARRFLDRASYKNDARKKQTEDHRVASKQVVSGLRSETLKRTYGFVVEMDRSRERICPGSRSRRARLPALRGAGCVGVH